MSKLNFKYEEVDADQISKINHRRLSIILPTATEVESRDLAYRKDYNYIVNFSDLFDIEFLKDFYYKIHGRPLSEPVVDSITKNISIQQRWSRLNTI